MMTRKLLQKITAKNVYQVFSPYQALSVKHSAFPTHNKCVIVTYILRMRKRRHLSQLLEMSAKWGSQDLEPKQFDYRTDDLDFLTKINDFGFGVIILHIHFIWTTEQ